MNDPRELSAALVKGKGRIALWAGQALERVLAFD
jgi:hypothetical protein